MSSSCNCRKCREIYKIKNEMKCKVKKCGDKKEIVCQKRVECFDKCGICYDKPCRCECEQLFYISQPMISTAFSSTTWGPTGTVQPCGPRTCACRK